MRGALTQALGHGLHARANVNYTSSLAVQQRYQQDILQTNNRSRNIGGNVTGNWSEYVLSATAEKNDTFYGEDSLTTTGGLPRVTFSRGERPIGRSKIYFGVNSEYVTQLYKTEDQGATYRRPRPDPGRRHPGRPHPVHEVAVPDGELQHHRGAAPTGARASIRPTGRADPREHRAKSFDFQARLTGPVFNRIFDTPNKAYAQKFKHVVEPTFTIERVTAIDVFNRVVQIDGSDRIPGSVTRISYGVNNRPLREAPDVARDRRRRR